jgi:hypothetical protein
VPPIKGRQTARKLRKGKKLEATKPLSEKQGYLTLTLTEVAIGGTSAPLPPPPTKP